MPRFRHPWRKPKRERICNKISMRKDLEINFLIWASWNFFGGTAKDSRLLRCSSRCNLWNPLITFEWVFQSFALTNLQSLSVIDSLRVSGVNPSLLSAFCLRGCQDVERLPSDFPSPKETTNQLFLSSPKISECTKTERPPVKQDKKCWLKICVYHTFWGN